MVILTHSMHQSCIPSLKLLLRSFDLIDGKFTDALYLLFVRVAFPQMFYIYALEASIWGVLRHPVPFRG